ncbi:hypothetical protein ACJIZ3_020969 [Penstemon smallii]|uniref:Uncharacterized protein n=1 Tax=Penstemon smallii TaxID=265156 RepID=A0ABD3SKC6_9LAMI
MVSYIPGALLPEIAIFLFFFYKTFENLKSKTLEPSEIPNQAKNLCAKKIPNQIKNSLSSLRCDLC